MESLIQWISHHAFYAHWIIFGAILLAGINIPISIDALVIISAIIAATVVPSHVLYFFFSIFFGCCFSAWISYWIGNKCGAKFLSFKIGRKIFPEKRIQKIVKFYAKYGALTLIIGRFIPFGIRNCIFMSSGMTKVPFKKFVLWDTLGCFLWSALSFYTFFTIGKNYETLSEYAKKFNIFIFMSLGVTLITLFWYKSRKNRWASEP